MIEHYAIGIDLGGSNIKGISVSQEGEIIDKEICETEDLQGSGWIKRVKYLVKKLGKKQDKKFQPLGVAAPGIASRDNSFIEFMPGRLKGLERLDWTRFFNSPHKIPVINDAHAALLGESWKGAAKGYQNAVLLMLGTGVGGAILSKGQLLKGHIGRAGHFGHLCLNPDGTPDIVGTPGSLEEALGNSSLFTRSRGLFDSTQILLEAHRSGDMEATALWLRSVYLLACGITSIINIIDPEVIIIGGGIIQAGTDLFKPLDLFLSRIEWQPGGYRVSIKPALLGELAGAFGAAWYAMNFQTNRK